MTHIMTDVLMGWKHIDYIHGDIVVVWVTLPHLGRSYPVFKFEAHASCCPSGNTRCME